MHPQPSVLLSPYYTLLTICRPLFSYIEVLLSKIVQKCVFFFCLRTWVITVSTLIALTCLMNEDTLINKQARRFFFFITWKIVARGIFFFKKAKWVCSFIRQVKVEQNWRLCNSTEFSLSASVHSDAFCLFLVHWGLEKPLLKIQGGLII